jgi:hypothetical protein
LELFQHDLVHLSDHLKLINERMVLVNPKFDEPKPQELDSEDADEALEEKDEKS